MRGYGADIHSVLEGIVSREATSTEDEELKGYGDPSSNAEAMALKRAAAKVGLPHRHAVSTFVGYENKYIGIEASS